MNNQIESSNKSYYDILEITNKASSNEIKKAYREAIRKYHPDKTTGDVNLFKEVNKAYKVLSKQESRRNYDFNLKFTLPSHKASTHSDLKMLAKKYYQDLENNEPEDLTIEERTKRFNEVMKSKDNSIMSNIETRKLSADELSKKVDDIRYSREHDNIENSKLMGSKKLTQKQINAYFNNKFSKELVESKNKIKYYNNSLTGDYSFFKNNQEKNTFQSGFSESANPQFDHVLAKDTVSENQKIEEFLANYEDEDEKDLEEKDSEEKVVKLKNVFEKYLEERSDIYKNKDGHKNIDMDDIKIERPFDSEFHDSLQY